MYLDARGDSITGNVWKDRSGKDNNVTFAKQLVTDGWWADMASGGQGNGPDWAAVLPNASYTVCVISRTKVLTTSQPLFVASTGDGGDRGFACHIPWVDGVVYFDNMKCCDVDINRQSYQMSAAAVEQEHMYTFSRTASGAMDVYVDGERVVKGKRGVAAVPKLTGPFIVNRFGNWNADMSVLLVYGQSISSNSIRKIWSWYTLQRDKPLLEPILSVKFPISKPIIHAASKQALTFTRKGHAMIGPPSSSLGLGSQYSVIIRGKLNVNGILLEVYGYEGCKSGKIGSGNDSTGNRRVITISVNDRQLIFDQSGCKSSRISAPITNVDNDITMAFVSGPTGRAITLMVHRWPVVQSWHRSCLAQLRPYYLQ